MRMAGWTTSRHDSFTLISMEEFLLVRYEVGGITQTLSLDRGADLAELAGQIESALRRKHSGLADAGLRETVIHGLHTAFALGRNEVSLGPLDQAPASGDGRQRPGGDG